MSYPMTAPDPAHAAPVTDAPQSAPATSYRLTRPGMRPLIFQGSELAMAMSYTPDIPYWYELNIYRTSDQRFALAIRQFFSSTIEEDRCKAWEFDSLMAVFDFLENYDAAEDVRIDCAPIDGVPAAELAARAYDVAARVAAQRTHFASLVGELFAEMESAGQTV